LTEALAADEREAEAEAVCRGRAASDLLAAGLTGLVTAFVDRAVTALGEALFLRETDAGALFLDAELAGFGVAATA
jgi:hypothetical protein